MEAKQVGTRPMTLELQNPAQALALLARLLKLTPETVDWLRGLKAAELVALGDMLKFFAEGRDEF